MKILILTPQLPYPPHQGTTLRNYYILKGLSQSHQLTLLTFAELPADPTPTPTLPEELTTLCNAIHTVPHPNRRLSTRLKRLFTDKRPDMAHRLQSAPFDESLTALLTNNSFDVVQVEGIELAQSIALIRQHSPQSRVIFDNHNAETELQRRAFLTDLRSLKRWPAAAYSWIQVGRLHQFERWACQMADAVAVVSDTDANHIRSLDITTSVTVIPNSLDIAAYQTAAIQPKISYDLVFSGKMDYRPNIDAALWFADEIWPHILAKRPHTTWAIVGQKPHPRLDRLRTLPGVTITNWVESIQPYLAGAAVFIMPFRMGSGTRLKLIEAMAAAKAIVSTLIGAEGFPVEDNKQLLLASDPADFAQRVLALLENENHRQALGRQAAQFANQYDWRVVVPKFEALYKRSG